jgi:hypothetical protein
LIAKGQLRKITITDPAFLGPIMGAQTSSMGTAEGDMNYFRPQLSQYLRETSYSRGGSG